MSSKKPAPPSAYRLTVRLWDPADRAKLEQLRIKVGAELGRIPSMSEMIATLGPLAHDDAAVRAALVSRLAQHDHKAAAS